MFFNILGEETSWEEDVAKLLAYFEGNYEILREHLHIEQKLQIDARICKRLIKETRNDANFPHNGGICAASPFKKVAFFILEMLIHKPIRSHFPANIKINGHSVSNYHNHQNAYMAYFIATDSLNEAKIHQSNGKIVTLDKKIKVSTHTFLDLLDAMSNIKEDNSNLSFKFLSILFEQLAYRYNPTASYEVKI